MLSTCICHVIFHYLTLSMYSSRRILQYNFMLKFSFKLETCNEKFSLLEITSLSFCFA